MPAEKNAAEFKREERYIVIKRKDLKKVPVAYRAHLVDPMFSLLAHLPRRECLVIESDWPEYEPAWAMIEARMTGQPPALGATPEAWATDDPHNPELSIDVVSFSDHRAHVAPLLAEIERLRGIQPDFPPRPPEGDGLPRYGLRWNGPQQPLATPMDDGYWTPWHLAEKLQSQLAEMVSAIRTLNYGPRHAQQLPSDDQPTYPQRQDWVEWILELCDDAEATLKPIAP